jgi:membrane protease YdiL (CAAX protease family)
MLSPQMRREIGWTLATRPGTLPVAFINIAILAIAGFALLGSASDQDLTLERVLFDTTHPNLVEEIVFRGFMLALLDRAFGTRWTFGGARIGWGVVLTAWLFGLVHGIALDADGALVFSLPYLLLTCVAGLVLGWIRALTGSLWPAFLAHAAPEAGILLALVVR